MIGGTPKEEEGVMIASRTDPRASLFLCRAGKDG